MVRSDWLKSKNRRKSKEKRDKNNFFSFIFPILLSFTSRPSLSIVLCANQKLERKTCNTRVTLLWTILNEMWGNLSFTRRNVVNFIAEIYIFPFIDCLLLLFNVFYHRSDREIPTAAAFVAVLSMSSSGHTKLLYIADDFTIPSKHPFHRREDFWKLAHFTCEYYRTVNLFTELLKNTCEMFITVRILHTHWRYLVVITSWLPLRTGKTFSLIDLWRLSLWLL